MYKWYENIYVLNKVINVFVNKSFIQILSTIGIHFGICFMRYLVDYNTLLYYIIAKFQADLSLYNSGKASHIF